MAFCSATAKCFLFLLNTIFFITGIAVAITSVLIYKAFYQHDLFLEKLNVTSPPIMVLVAGIVITVIALLGCCGLIRNSKTLLFVFSTLLALIFVSEVAIGLYGYQMSDDVADSIKLKMNETMYSYKTDKSVKHSWDFLQYDFHCCGISNATDWKAVLGDYPSSCCQRAVLDKCPTDEVYKIGCFTVFEQFVLSQTYLLAGIAISVGIIQLLVVVVSCLLARSITGGYEAV